MAHAASVVQFQCADLQPAQRAALVLAKPEAVLVDAALGERKPSDGFPHGFPKGQPPPTLLGATLRIAAPHGATAAWLQRELECHQSEVVLGRVRLTDNDPYAIPNDWLDIAVTEQGNGFVVETRAASRSAAEAALERAMRFQAAQQAFQPP
jgi:hypothetical protein